ncbi:MAG TPA: SGNH/GDSL hydrolase family protein [Pyrinomonadaceae bacterium]|jgi:lysophospholipase L1-like esterase
MRTDSIPQNWVFLGDSLTEGIGSQRLSHVTELVKTLRAGEDFPAVHHLRLREIDTRDFDRFVNFNVAGFLETEPPADPSLWIWNLACEGRTIEDDFAWIPLVKNLQPEWVVIFRGSLESIIRPAMVRDGRWPFWVPQSWRNYSSMDPRCYFSSTWWRQAKQRSVDRAKQVARRKLLAERVGQPLVELDAFAGRYEELLSQLRSSAKQILMLGLLPVDEKMFPGSSEYFAIVTKRLRELATRFDVNFLDWGGEVTSLERCSELFYRDGFHPNSNGARVLAEILRRHLLEARFVRSAVSSLG